jgi:hypothetical protein
MIDKVLSRTYCNGCIFKDADNRYGVSCLLGVQVYATKHGSQYAMKCKSKEQ